MTCEEVFKRLYEALNSGVENLTSEVLTRHYEICQTCCKYCRFDAQVIKAMQENCFKDRPESDLRVKILKDINLQS
ncbi:MAG: hypothetical protein A2W25_14845 [candidate division Zixibacteria bacterium RBG_16_53_22]|nr:MAG: hypothetical protein A2W25_14845 [candidate division Zixibacteria bacterium RBG_16_53_22]